MVRDVVRLFKGIDCELYFEVWNEPDGEYWREGVDTFMRLYKETVEAVKAEDPTAKVGGTAVNQYDGRLRKDPKRDPLNLELIRFCAKEGVPLDFISWHHFGRPISVIQEAKDRYTAEFKKCGYKKLPEFIVTEWSVPGRGTEYEAAGMAEMLLGFYRAKVDAQTVSAWEEFHKYPETNYFPPWGMITQQGRKHPRFHAHKFVDRLSRDSEGVAVIMEKAEDRFLGGRRVVVSKKKDGTFDVVVWETGYDPPMGAALSYLVGEGMTNEEFRPYRTMERLEEAISKGRSISRKRADEFKEAQKRYHEAARRGSWIQLEFSQPVDVLSGESVRMDLHTAQAVAAGKRVAFELKKGGVMRLRLKPR